MSMPAITMLNLTLGSAAITDDNDHVQQIRVNLDKIKFHT